MGDTRTKYNELVEAGKIDPNKPIKRLPLLTQKEVRQIAYEVGLWAIDIAAFVELEGMGKPTEVIFKEKFDNWIEARMNLNK